MDRAAIRTQLQALVAPHVPRNARRYKYRVFDGQPQESVLGFRVDPHPFEGKVIATTDEAIVVQTGRAEFAVVDRSLATEVPAAGTKVRVKPYARRRFDGERADSPEVRTEYRAGGIPYTVNTAILGSAPAKLPVPEPECPYLHDLIEQMEKLPAPDGIRFITHMLVDAGAKDFTWVDPKPKDIITTPPAISFEVSTTKFKGRVTVLFDRGGDVYVVELYQGNERVERIDNVHFDTLGATLATLIDDGRWRQIQIEVLPPGRRQTRH